jgi:hypothetical protein
VFGTNEYKLSYMVKKSLDRYAEVRLVTHAEKYPYTLLTRITIGALNFIGMDFFLRHYKSKVNKLLKLEFIDFKPEILLVLKGNMLEVNTLLDLNAYKVLLLWDSIKNASLKTELVRVFDMIFTFNKSDIPFIRNINGNVKYLRLGYSEHYSNIRQIKDIDILISGSLNKFRFKIAHMIQGLHKNLKVVIAGPPNSLLFGIYIRLYLLIKKTNATFLTRNLNHDILNELYNRSKIIVNIPQELGSKSMNMRFYESIATKTMQIVYRTEESSRILSDKFLFENQSELLSKLSNAISNYEQYYIEYLYLINNSNFNFDLEHVFNELIFEISQEL